MMGEIPLLQVNAKPDAIGCREDTRGEGSRKVVCSGLPKNESLSLLDV